MKSKKKRKRLFRSDLYVFLCVIFWADSSSQIEKCGVSDGIQMVILHAGSGFLFSYISLKHRMIFCIPNALCAKFEPIFWLIHLASYVSLHKKIAMKRNYDFCFFKHAREIRWFYSVYCFGLYFIMNMRFRYTDHQITHLIFFTRFFKTVPHLDTSHTLHKY